MGSKMIIVYFSKLKLEVDSWNWFWLLRFKSPVWLFRGEAAASICSKCHDYCLFLLWVDKVHLVWMGKFPWCSSQGFSESTLNLNTETKAVAWLMVTWFLLRNSEVTERHITWKDKKQTRYWCIFPWNFKHHADVRICDNKVNHFIQL